MMANSPIKGFKDDYRFLSNFWPCSVVLEGVNYESVEHAYVAAKTKDLAIRKEIAKLPKPGMAKKFGRTLRLREDWDKIKLGVMKHLLRQKFGPLRELADKLAATYPRELIETNTWGDTFWGVCKGEGENWLGRLLMLVRSDLFWVGRY